MLYQTVDLFCTILDHIPLVGIDIAKLIHQQLYHEVVLPLLTSLASLVNMIGCFLDNLQYNVCCYSNRVSYSAVCTLQRHVLDY